MEINTIAGIANAGRANVNRPLVGVNSGTAAGNTTFTYVAAGTDAGMGAKRSRLHHHTCRSPRVAG